MDVWKPGPQHRQAIIDIGFSTFSAIAAAILRKYDHERFGEIITRLVGQHHHTYFVEGLRKLGLDSEESDAIKSAKYHYYSNSIGGINMGYGEDDKGRGWIFYPTPWYWFDSPYSPSVGAAVVRSEVVTEFYRPWHGQNGPTLGNPRLGFMFTHQVARGDPYDAGYFYESDQPLGPGDTLKTSWGETPPAIQRPPLDPAIWTEQRLFKAVSKYHVGYIGNVLHQLLRALGTAESAEIVEHGYRVFLFQYRGKLARYLDVDLEAPFSVATLLARFQELFREQVDVRTEGETAVVTQQGSYLQAFSETPIPAELERAISDSWAALTRLANPGLTMRQTASVAAGDGRMEWTFEPRVASQ
jgi:hypothetical protein